MWRVVWRPRPSFSDTSPVGSCKEGHSRFKRLLLPTPELPDRATTFPVIFSRSASTPSPVTALVEMTS